MSEGIDHMMKGAQEIKEKIIMTVAEIPTTTRVDRGNGNQDLPLRHQFQEIRLSIQKDLGTMILGIGNYQDHVIQHQKLEK